MRRKQLDRVLREETGNYSLFLPTVRTGSRQNILYSFVAARSSKRIGSHAIPSFLIQ